MKYKNKKEMMFFEVRRYVGSIGLAVMFTFIIYSLTTNMNTDDIQNNTLLKTFLIISLIFGIIGFGALFDSFAQAHLGKRWRGIRF